MKRVSEAFRCMQIHSLRRRRGKVLREQLSRIYLGALAVMIAGSALVAADTLIRNHAHPHRHSFTHEHDGFRHTHTIQHVHAHDHYVTEARHGHRNTLRELEAEPGASHTAR